MRGHFLRSISSNKNDLEYISILKCSPISNSGVDSISLKGGNQNIFSCNSSYNNANYATSFAFYNEIILNFNFNNIYNNTASNFCSIYLTNGKNNHFLNNSNIIQNNSPNYAVIFLQGNTRHIITNCIFYNNFNTLFCSYWVSTYGGDAILIVHDCKIYHLNKLTTLVGQGLITLSNNILEFTNSFEITHFSTGFCFAEKPLKIISSFKFQNLNFFLKKLIIISFLMYL